MGDVRVPLDLGAGQHRLNISGCWLRMSAYAITAYNQNPAPGERDNPVYLPDATLRVTGGT